MLDDSSSRYTYSLPIITKPHITYSDNSKKLQFISNDRNPFGLKTINLEIKATAPKVVRAILSAFGDTLKIVFDSNIQSIVSECQDIFEPNVLGTGTYIYNFFKHLYLKIILFLCEFIKTFHKSLLVFLSQFS